MKYESVADKEEKRLGGRGVVAAMIGGADESPPTLGRPKEDREIKRRVSLAVLPSVYEDIKKIAYVRRKSVSELTSELYVRLVAESGAVLKKYEEIKNEGEE